MSSQENNHQNDNQLLIDFIKDTYTIESNKHFFVLIPYLIDCITGYEGRFKRLGWTPSAIVFGHRSAKKVMPVKCCWLLCAVFL